MSESATWQADNSAYLGAAVRWVRLRLERQVALHQPESTAAPADSPAHEFVGGLRRWLPEHPALRTLAEPMKRLPEITGARSNVSAPASEISAAKLELDRLRVVETPPAPVLLAHAFGLSPFEEELLLLCLAHELDTRVPNLCAQAQGDPSRPFPTFALGMVLSDEPSWDALSPERPLRHFRIVELSQAPGVPLTASTLRLDERVVSFMKGLNYLDERVAPLVSTTPTPRPSDLSESQRALVDHISARLQTAPASPGPVILRLVGNDLSARRATAAAAAARARLNLLRLPAHALAPFAADIDGLSRLWQREAQLLPITLFIEADEAGGHEANDAGLQALLRFVARLPLPLFLSASDSVAAQLEGVTTFTVDRPTPDEQTAHWTKLLPELDDVDSARLTSNFHFNLFDIEQLASAAQGAAPAERFARLWQACREHVRPDLGPLAQRIDARATWNDIVMPEPEMAMLRQLAAQVHARRRVYDEWGFRGRMSRGLGISALFAGDSGTGKTMAAEVLANALALDLYRIDLSAVVSKYIGETEKNLRKVFDAAEKGGAILFFDEADALFGKRSEVKDAHDRYANIEINYLLQRMEAFGGLAILATNMKSALDPAFVRRLRFIVQFAYPQVAERKRIWQGAFPAAAPTKGLDFDRLARFDLTGGNIHSVALNAAFMAADRNTPLGMPVVLDAVRLELRKLDRPINEAELRWQPASEAVA